MKLLWPILYKHKFKCMIIFVLSALTLSGEVMVPIIISEIITFLVSIESKDLLISMCVKFLAVSIIIQILKYLNSILILKTFLSLSKGLLLYFFKEFYSYDLKDIFSQNKNIVAQIITNDTNKLIDFCIGNCLSIILSTLSCVFMVYLLFTKSYLFVLLLIIYTIFQVIYYNAIKSNILRLNIVGTEKRNKLYSYLVQSYELLKFIKINSLADNLKGSLSEKYNEFINISMQKENFTCRTYFLEQLVYLVIQVFVFFVAVEQISDGKLGVGEFTLCYSYFGIISSYLNSFLSFGKKYQDYKAACERLNGIINKTKVVNGHIVIDKISKIELKNFKFNFDNTRHFIYLDFKFSEGNIYGILGKNGVGKTTLINNIIGLHVNSGIYINDEALENLDMEAVRKNLFSVCEQECTVSNETIYYNLTLSRDFDEKLIFKIKDLLEIFNYKIENINEFLSKELNNTFLNLSMGEKQKLAIIRVLLEDKDVMIFDEPTASLDVNSCKRFTEIINKVKHNKIIIIISHDDNLKNIYDVDYEL